MKRVTAALRHPAALVLPILLAGVGCVQPVRVSIAQARERPASLLGGTVRVEGFVRRFRDVGGDYYVLEDADRNRLGLTGRIEPVLPSQTGRRCRVTGVLEYDPGRGLYLRGSRLEPTP